MKIKKLITGIVSIMMIFTSVAGNLSNVSAANVTSVIAESSEIKTGESTNVTVDAVIPEEAEIISYQWSSDNEAVAIVSGESDTATVQGLTAGKAKIKAVVNYEVKNDTEETAEVEETNDNEYVSAEVEITVTEKESVETSKEVKEETSEAVKATETTETESESAKKSYDSETVDYILSKIDNSYINGDIVLSNALIVKNMLVDGSLYQAGDTIDSILSSDKGDAMFIATLRSTVALYSNDESEYYVGLANTMYGDSKASVEDHMFAMNNENGEVIEGCVYDNNTGLAYIPKSFFKADDKVIAGNVQIQFLQVINQKSKTIKSEVEYVTTDGDEVKTGDKNVEAFDFETKVQTEKGLMHSEFTVSVNGVPVSDEGYTYDSDTGIVTLPVSSVSVQSVSVDVHEKGAVSKAVDKLLNISEVSALSMEQMGCAGTIDLPDGATVGSAWDVTLYNAYASDWGSPTMDAYGYYSEQELVNLSAYGGNIDWNKVVQQHQDMYLGVFLQGGWGIGPGGVAQNLPNLWNWTPEGATGTIDGWLRLQCTHVGNPLGNDANVDWGFAPVRIRVLALNDSEVVVSMLSRRVHTQSGSSIVKFKIRRKTGNLNITKVNGNPELTAGNNCYSLAGAEYQLRDGNGNTVATLVTDAAGNASASNIYAGNYTLVETKASPGFELNTGSTPVTITAGQTTTLNGTGVLVETPANDPATIEITKADADSGESTAQGNASLEGAEFTVKYYNGLYDKQSDLPEKATRTWVLQTKEAKHSDGSIHYIAFLSDTYKVSGDDFYYIDGFVTLPVGTVTIQETKAPEGYLLEGATLANGNGDMTNIEDGIYLTQITQASNGSPAKVVAGNFPVVKDEVKKHHIEIEKVALDHNGQSTPLNGAQFTIKLKSEVAEKGWDNAQTYDVVTTGTINGKDGQAVTKDLPYGTYIGRETITPAGYVKADDIEFTIDQDISETSKVQHIKVTDEETHIRIYKYDIETDDALKNAEYLIFNVTENKEVGRYTTDQNGIIDLYKLPGGNTYYVQETKAPAGYKIDDTKYYFEFDKNGYVSISDMNDQSVNKDVFTINSNGDMQISLSNKLAYFNLNLNKINDSDLKLKGAEFTLYSDENCTKAIATGTTDKNGNLKFNNVEVGTYWLKETKAPVGYRKLLDPIKVEFRCENKEHTFFVNDEAVTSEDGNYSMTIENDMYTGNMTIVNKVGAQLPATGSNMTLMLVGAGCAIMLGAFALNKKKSKGKE